ncbi:MAG: DUF2065 domain-containing protein [Xanthomonadales bacterium]|nr:DUF2065 domain-containing protein [Xanthomonadales bacterium]|tara:strand:+ start:1628 stop:1813 length:186 start_codon:yes stop_codon:yes gene_type:complete
MLEDLLLAFALVMVLEGLLPALNPGSWRRAMGQLAALPDRVIRRFGIVMIAIGALFFHLVR